MLPVLSAELSRQGDSPLSKLKTAGAVSVYTHHDRARSQSAHM